MIDKVIIRPAVVTDCPALMGLVRELAIFEREPDAVTVTQQHFEESGFGNNPVWWAIVAETEEKVVGFALYYIRYSTWKGQRMYLEDLIVTEEYRGRGIGKMLLDELIEIAKQKGFSGMLWQVLEWNEPAIKFYEKYKASFDPQWVNVSLDF